MVAALVLEQELLFLPVEQLLPEQEAPFVQVDPVVQLEPLVQVVPLLQLLPLVLQPSLLKMLLISPDCPKQFERFV